MANISSTRQLRHALDELSKVKAIYTLRISQMTAQELDQNPGVKKRDRRGLVYKLNSFWAQETIEAHDYKWKCPDIEARKKIAARFGKRTEPDRYKRTEPDRYKADWNRPTNTLRDTDRTLARAQDEEVHNGCVDNIRPREVNDGQARDTTRQAHHQTLRPESIQPRTSPNRRESQWAANPYAQATGRVSFEPIPPPPTAKEGAEFLKRRGVPISGLERATKQLMEGHLSEYDIEGLIFDGRKEGAA